MFGGMPDASVLRRIEGVARTLKSIGVFQFYRGLVSIELGDHLKAGRITPHEHRLQLYPGE